MRNLKSIFFAATALAGALPAAAFAQSAAEPAEAGDIVVTARRVEERLQDVPISITVFNQQQLANNNVVSAADLAAYTPSLSANSNFGSQNSSYAIRGFVQEIGTSPSVGVYFADVVAPRAASNGLPAGDGAGPGAFFDLQNVQVLKGPQGTLFGRNTTGGSVLLVPQRPTGRLEGYVEGQIGNYDMRRVQAVINVPLSDSFRVRLGVDRMKRKGYLNNTSGVGPKDFNDVDYIAGRLSIVGDLTDNLENYTIATYSQSDTHGDVHKLIAADPNYSLGRFAAQQLTPGQPNYQGAGFYDVGQSLANPRSLLRTWQVINTTTWKASDTLTVKNIASYGQLYDYFNNPIFGTNFVSPAIPAIAALGFPGLPSYNFGFTSSQVAPGLATAHESTFTEEFRVAGNSPDGRLQWQAGAYFESVRPLGEVGSKSPVIQACPGANAVATGNCYDILGYLGGIGGFLGTLGAGGSFPAAIGAYNAGLVHAGAINVTTGRTAFRDIGLYAQGTYKLTDQFKLTVGLRYTWDKAENTSTQTTTLTSYPYATTPGTFLPFVPTPAAPVATFCTYVDAPVQNPAAPGGCTRSFVQKSRAPTWLIDLDWTPLPDMLVYAKYARGYRTGGIAPNVSPPYTTFGPERVDAYEIGAKTGFRGAVSGTFNIAAFYNDFRNQQLQLGFNAAPGAAVTPTAAPINAGKSRIYGIEIDGQLNLFRGFILSGGYTYLNSRIQSVETFTLQPGSPFVVAGGYLAGDPLTLTPKNKFTLSGSYVLPLPDAIGRITLGATFTHTDSAFANPSDRFYFGCNGTAGANLPNCQAGAVSSPAVAAQIRALSRIPAYNLLNLNVNWAGVAGLPVDLGFFATNVTKEKYYTYIPGLATGTGFEDAVVGAPRMYGVSLRYRFGR